MSRLEDLLRTFEKNLDKIYVRDEVDGRVGTYLLSELSEEQAWQHIFRWIEKEVHMTKKEKQEAIAAAQFKEIVSSEQMEDDGSYRVTLSCGHTAIWFVKPYVVRTPCAQCVNELVAKHRKESE